jgi:hypothetical protein
MSNGRDNDKIHQQNERNVSVSEMDELIPPEGDLLLLLQKSMDRWPLHILLDTSKFTCRG